MIVHVHIDRLVVDAMPGVDVGALETDLASALSQGLANRGLAPWPTPTMQGGALAVLAMPLPGEAADGRLGQRIAASLLQGLAPADGWRP